MRAGAATAVDRIGPYQLVKAIGAGGSARIDLARVDRAYGFQRHVVIKRPLEHLRGDPKAAASLRREARIAARLRHPNLVTILDAGEHDGYDYLVLEYVHGGSLRELMQSETPAQVRDVPLEVALAIIVDVARGLHVAHELADATGAPLGLVHRDVSPGNVLIGHDGAVKLADFGIAKETRVATLSGSLHGTVTYMAPEQCRGHAFDRRADVFSLGVILYELVTGSRLFWADNDVASLHRVLSGTVPRPRKVRPGLAPALEDIVLTALAQDPERRHPTARAFADALEDVAAQGGHLLGARWIARWVHDLIGPRDVPWIGDVTQVDAVPRGDGSLVALIAATPEEAPPAVTFGPTDGPPAEDVPTGRRRPARPGHPAPRRRRALATVIAVGLAGSAAVAGYVVTRSAPPPAGQPQAIPSAPAPAPGAAPATIEGATEPSATEAASAARAPTPEPANQATRDDTRPPVATGSAAAPRPRPTADGRRRRITKPALPTATTVRPSPSTLPPPPPATGSGSQAIRTSPTQVEWRPTMLLPTDAGSGTKKR